MSNQDSQQDQAPPETPCPLEEKAIEQIAEMIKQDHPGEVPLPSEDEIRQIAEDHHSTIGDEGWQDTARK